MCTNGGARCVLPRVQMASRAKSQLLTRLSKELSKEVERDRGVRHP